MQASNPTTLHRSILTCVQMSAPASADGILHFYQDRPVDGLQHPEARSCNLADHACCDTRTHTGNTRMWIADHTVQSLALHAALPCLLARMLVPQALCQGSEAPLQRHTSQGSSLAILQGTAELAAVTVEKSI